MRLTEDQIRQGLQHSDKDVRFAALRYFATSYSRNTAVMPEVIAVIDRLGPYNAFPYTFPIADLAQTEETISWAVTQLQRKPTNEKEDSFTSHIAWLLCNADPMLVLPHKSVILKSPGLNREWASRLEQRLGFVSTPSDQLWKRLEAICETGKGKMHPNDISYSEAEEIAESLGRDATQAERMMELLHQEVNPEVETYLIWLEIFLVQMAGTMRYEPALPLIIKKLLVEGEILSEDCVKALTKIGTDAVVQAVRNQYPRAPDHFRLYASGIFGNIHSDLAVTAGLEMLSIEHDYDRRTWLANALVDQFATEAIEAGRTVLLEEDPDSNDLKSSLVAACKLMAYDVPELKQWEKALAKPKRAFASRGFPSTLISGSSAEASDLDEEPEILPVSSGRKVGRNDPCPCGSGKKFKKCCLNKPKAPR